MASCPICGTSMDFIEQYDQWYCPNCSRYNPLIYSQYPSHTKSSDDMKMIISILVIISIIIVSIFILFFLSGPVNDEIESGHDFHFKFHSNTVNNLPHPEFIKDQVNNTPIFVYFAQNDEICPPSARMRPEIEKLKDKYSSKVIFYTININEHEMEKNYKNKDEIEPSSHSEVENIYSIYDVDNIADGRVATPTFVIVMKDLSEIKFAVGYGEFKNEDAQQTGNELEKNIEYALSMY